MIRGADALFLHRWLILRLDLINGPVYKANEEILPGLSVSLDFSLYSTVLMNRPFSATAVRASENSAQNAARYMKQALLPPEDNGRLWPRRGRA